MEQQRRDYAAKWAAQVKLRLEECALGMGRRSNYAAVFDAQITPRMKSMRKAWGKSQTMLCGWMYKYSCQGGVTFIGIDTTYEVWLVGADDIENNRQSRQTLSAADLG